MNNYVALALYIHNKQTMIMWNEQVTFYEENFQDDDFVYYIMITDKVRAKGNT